MKLRLSNSFLLSRSAVFTAMAMAFLATAAHADNLVTNGSFESLTNGPGQLGYNTNATGWTSAAPPGSYNFVFAAGTGDTTGSNGQYGNLSLWGPNNGANNGLPATSPDGGNYVAMDGAFQVGAISQTLTGLTAGDSYAVSFYWGGVQQYTFSGPTTEGLTVSFGSQSQSTTTVSNPSHGFSGWESQTFTFTADGTSDVLSFLASGTPSGEPPFTLLDGVSVSPVPEPSSLALLATGLFGVGGYVRSRFKKA